MWDGVTPYQYPFPYDTMMEDTTYSIGIGDWYEPTENIFYRPLSIPPDFPPAQVKLSLGLAYLYLNAANALSTQKNQRI